MNGLPPEVMRALQDEYVLTFPAKARELLEAYKKKDHQELVALFHKLAGSGKTYDFGGLSTVAKEGELYLLEMKRLDAKVDQYLKRILKEFRDIQNTKKNPQAG